MNSRLGKIKETDLLPARGGEGRPTAYEFHNPHTGDRYVGYTWRVNKGYEHGYGATPLWADSHKVRAERLAAEQAKTARETSADRHWLWLALIMGTVVAGGFAFTVGVP